MLITVFLTMGALVLGLWLGVLWMAFTDQPRPRAGRASEEQQPAIS